MADSGVYKIQCENGYKYYGRSQDIQLRLCSHKKDLQRGNHVSKKMQKDFNKLGISAFKFTIIKKTTDYRSASILEKTLVNKNIKSGKSYNTKIIRGISDFGGDFGQDIVGLWIKLPSILIEEVEKEAKRESRTRHGMIRTIIRERYLCSTVKKK